MKRVLFLFLVVLNAASISYAQKNSCDNTILVYAPETTISNLDSSVHDKIRRYFRSYLVSQQQAYNYKLVDQPYDAEVQLITDYTLENPTLWSQTTKLTFEIQDIEDPSLRRTIIEAYNTSDSSIWKTGKDVISHNGTDFLEKLQSQNSLYPFFAPITSINYRHTAMPDMVLVVDPFETELFTIAEHQDCLQAFLTEGLKSRTRFEKHNINISFRDVPNSTPEDTKVVHVRTEVIEEYEEYILTFMAGDIYLDEIYVRKDLLDSRKYRPFIKGQIAAAGGSLIAEILKRVK